MRRLSNLAVVVLLALALGGCGWLQEGFNAGQTASNDFERTLGVANVGSLVDQQVPGLTGPIKVVGNLLLVVNASGLHAFDRSACPTPSQSACTPLWERAGVVNVGSDGSSIFVSDGSVGLVALDMTGRVLWDFSMPFDRFYQGRIAISDGYVLFATLVRMHNGSIDQTVHVLPAAGCGAAHCAATRSFKPEFNPAAEWAVDRGRVFWVSFVPTTTMSIVVASDLATGTELWRSQPESGFFSMIARDGRVYVVRGSATGVLVYDQAGAQCSGVPKTCAPQRVLFTPGISDLVAASGNHIVAMSQSLTVAHWFRNDATGCTGVPLTCAPVASTNAFAVPGDGNPGLAAVANGVVYISTGNKLLAYDEAAVQGCAGTPRVCNPLVTKTFANDISGPIIWDGKVYVFSSDALHALHLPN